MLEYLPTYLFAPGFAVGVSPLGGGRLPQVGQTGLFKFGTVHHILEQH